MMANHGSTNLVGIPSNNHSTHKNAVQPYHVNQRLVGEWCLSLQLSNRATICLFYPLNLQRMRMLRSAWPQSLSAGTPWFCGSPALMEKQLDSSHGHWWFWMFERFHHQSINDVMMNRVEKNWFSQQGALFCWIIFRHHSWQIFLVHSHQSDRPASTPTTSARGGRREQIGVVRINRTLSLNCLMGITVAVISFRFMNPEHQGYLTETADCDHSTDWPRCGPRQQTNQDMLRNLEQIFSGSRRWVHLGDHVGRAGRLHWSPGWLTRYSGNICGNWSWWIDRLIVLRNGW